MHCQNIRKCPGKARPRPAGRTKAETPRGYVKKNGSPPKENETTKIRSEIGLKHVSELIRIR